MKKPFVLIFAICIAACLAQPIDFDTSPSAETASPHEARIVDPTPASTADTLAPRERPEEPMATCLEVGDGTNDIIIANPYGNVGIGRTDPQQKLEVLGTARITSTSYPGPSGDYRYIDIYSSSANHIDASNDLYIRPKGGLILQPGYPTSGAGNIEVKDGGGNVYGTFIGANRHLNMTGTAGGLRLGANNWSDGGTSYGHLVSDNGSYKALMIVGNNISGNSGRGREVKVWDYLNVQGAFNVTGQFVSVGNTSVVSNLNADLLDGNHASAFAPASGSGNYHPYGGNYGLNLTANALYYDDWVRNGSSGATGLYWEGGTGAYWHIYPRSQQDMYFRTGSGNGGIVGTIANETPRGYIHWTTSNEIGFLDNTRNWQLRSFDGGTEIYDITYMNDARAYIFYDRANTAYYLNPDGYSNLSDIGWGNSGTRTQTRDNAGLRGDAGARSGFFETASPTNYYPGASSWQHLLDVRHSNNSNNYAMQFAGSFFDQRLFFRKTHDNAAKAWSQIPVSSTGSISAYTTTTIYSDEYVDIQWNASYYQPQFLHKTSQYWWDVTWNMQNGSGTQYRDGDDIATSSWTWYYFSGEGSLNTSLGLGYSGSIYGSDGTYWLGRESEYASSAYKIDLFRRGSAVTYVVTRYH